MFRRLLFDILLIFSTILAPWWLSFTLGAFGAFSFRAFYEMIFVGAILDTLYGAHLPFVGDRPFLFSFIGVLLFLFIEFIKPKLRIYEMVKKH